MKFRHKFNQIDLETKYKTFSFYIIEEQNRYRQLAKTIIKQYFKYQFNQL